MKGALVTAEICVLSETNGNTASECKVMSVFILKMISSPYCAFSRVCLRFLFCITSQNVNISQVLSLHTSQVAHQVGANPGFRSMKRLGMFLLPAWIGC